MFLTRRSRPAKGWLRINNNSKPNIQNFDMLKDCTTKEEALEMDALLYELAQKVQGDMTCSPICDLPKYESELNFLSKLTLSKEIKKYGQGIVTNI